MRFARTIPFPVAPLVAVLCLALAACGDAPDAGSDSRNADGEVLEGSISDAMIPFDQLRSQGEPLEPDATSEGEGGAANPAAGSDATGSDSGGSESGATDSAADGGSGAAPDAVSEVPKQAAPDEG